jgi:glycosyltransferase involved in cell wall biosynthesis
MESFKPRVLVLAHAHPDFSLGGGEIAAYNLYKALRDDPAVEEAWFLGRVDRGRGATGHISLRRANEYLWEQGIGDWHKMTAAHRDSLTTWFADLIRALKPNVVHAHHYMHLGLEFIRVVKQVDPSIRIFFTLHEYMAICRNNGQMVKTNSTRLCSRASHDECRACFPQSTAEDFWLRKHFFMSHFDLVDQFVSPSEFLKNRYVQWGIAPERIVVVENGQSDEPPLPPRPLAEGETRNRIGFFGQITPFKGLDVVLEALKQLPKEERKQLRVEVHGANLEMQTADYREKVESLREPLIRQGVLRWVGPYQPHELRSRMAAVDWVLVPSIWWENSPMVIQEAFVCGRPLLVSDIGGMAEKVRDNVDGLHVRTGNALDWGTQLLRATDPALWDRLQAGIRRPLNQEESARVHVELYRRARAHASATAAPVVAEPRQAVTP